VHRLALDYRKSSHPSAGNTLGFALSCDGSNVCPSEAAGSSLPTGESSRHKDTKTTTPVAEEEPGGCFMEPHSRPSWILKTGFWPRYPMQSAALPTEPGLTQRTSDATVRAIMYSVEPLAWSVRSNPNSR